MICEKKKTNLQKKKKKKRKHVWGAHHCSLVLIIISSVFIIINGRRDFLGQTLVLGRTVLGCLLSGQVRRTHPQVRPYDAVVGAPLPHAAAVRRARHPHGAAAPVVLGGALIRLQRSCENRRTALIQGSCQSRSESGLRCYQRFPSRSALAHRHS